MESNNIYVPYILLPASVWKKPFTEEKITNTMTQQGPN